MARTQETSHISIGTPIQNADILLRSFRSREELGRPFRIDAELLSDFEIPLEDLLGHNVTIRLTPDVSNDSHMYFNGFVSRLVHEEQENGLWVYRARIVPWIWFLSRTADCVIFQNKTVPEIIEQVFRDHGFSNFESALDETYQPREYCVQWKETAFDFVSRLMEEEGIYYYFKHEDGKHTLVLVDSPAAHQPVPEHETIEYKITDEGLSREGVFISAWSVAARVRSGAVVLDDFDFVNPQRGRLLGKGMITRGHAVPDFEVYDYPGQYVTPEDAERYARLRIEALQADYQTAEGDSNVRELAPGFTFELEGHPREDQNRKYLVTHVERHAVDTSYTEDKQPLYESEFTVIDAQQPFRLARITPKQLVHGPQTAMVVGPEGNELHTDEHGRVKVMFHWDRLSKGDQDSSCWVRVAQGLAGNKWGMFFLPRIGQEVVVEFLDGDPDRPLITGRVYNGKSPPPYTLPDYASMSTIKTNSTPDGGGFNEIRFEDKKGEEQIFVHGEKNVDVRIKNDAFEWIGNDRHLIVKKDQIEKVENNRNETVANDHIEEIGKDRHLKVKGKEAKAVLGSLSLTVAGDVIEVFKAKHSESVSGDYYLKADNIVIEATTNITIKVGGTHIVIESGGIAIGSDAAVEIEAGATMDLKASAPINIKSDATAEIKSSATTVKGDGMLTLKGGMVMIN